MAKIKPLPKILAVALLIGGGIFGTKFYLESHGSTKMASSVPVSQEQLVELQETDSPATTPQTAQAGLPTETPASLPSKPIRALVLPWNAQMGLALANGGPETTKGSLMEKAGVNLRIERQDDYSKLQGELIACANQLAKGAKNCTQGANFLTIMGDAGPAFFAGLNGQLEKLGPEYKAEIVGSLGRSNGEDAFMAPQAVKDDPQAGKGLLVSGVVKDGDWNLAMFWAAQNEVCNNPDLTTYDPDCLNWVGTSSFVEAGEKYIQGACETRPVVSGGKRTGEKREVCVGAVVTWTPGDATIAKKKGGLARILSTKENASQMACTLIGIKKWDRENADTVKGILGATFEAGQQIRSGPAGVLKRAAEASAKIYKEESPAFWARYYKGITEEDATGVDVQLGGSRVFTLADNVRYFGLEQGSANAYAATYKLFGDIMVQQYKNDLPKYPPVEDILNVRFINEMVAEGVQLGRAEAPVFSSIDSNTEVISKRSWRINFETGSAKFAKDGEKELGELLTTLVVASDTYVEIVGHTDDVGSASNNLVLSRNRALAVKNFLEGKASGSFPQNRIKVEAKGQEQPVAPNTTPLGRSQNRRVDVLLKASGS